MLGFWKRHRREEILARPFPPAWRAILDKNVPYVARLDAAEQRELEGLVAVFLEEKSFEGCGGLELNDEIRVTIAGQACLLLLHREADVYPDLDSILVYPSAYKAKSTRREGGVVLEGEEARLGESWTRGTVVLAWDHVKSGARNLTDGHNVVLHEFAHQLDAEDGSMDGAPELGERSHYATWARVLGDEFADLASRLHEGRKTDIDPYGATNPSEFFAVLTETFFEKPIELSRRHPELYEELRAFYKQDPAARLLAKRPRSG